jgi:hypothetical protein
MRNRSWTVSLVVVALAGLAPRACADGVPPGTVTGQGTVELKRQPETLRVHVDMMAKGLHLKEALAKLKQHREAALVLFDTFGVDRNSVEFGEPQVTSEKTERQKQVEMMMRQQLRAQGKKEEKAKQPVPVVVFVPLKFEVPLKAADAEELLLQASLLQDKIKAADLGGLKDMKQIAPQDEELAQEIADQFPMDDNEPKRGEPVFLFVSKIADADQAQALAAAFQKARREAGRLAQAAGAELGALQHLENNSAASNMEDATIMVNNSNNAYTYQLLQKFRTNQTSSDGSPAEAIGLHPGKATYRVVISASFALKTQPK